MHYLLVGSIFVRVVNFLVSSSVVSFVDFYTEINAQTSTGACCCYSNSSVIRHAASPTAVAFSCPAITREWSTGPMIMNLGLFNHPCDEDNEDYDTACKIVWHTMLSRPTRSKSPRKGQQLFNLSLNDNQDEEEVDKLGSKTNWSCTKLNLPLPGRQSSAAPPFPVVGWIRLLVLPVRRLRLSPQVLHNAAELSNDGVKNYETRLLECDASAIVKFEVWHHIYSWWETCHVGR